MTNEQALEFEAQRKDFLLAVTKWVATVDKSIVCDMSKLEIAIGWLAVEAERNSYLRLIKKTKETK